MLKILRSLVGLFLGLIAVACGKYCALRLGAASHTSGDNLDHLCRSSRSVRTARGVVADPRSARAGQ